MQRIQRIGQIFKLELRRICLVPLFKLRNIILIKWWEINDNVNISDLLGHIPTVSIACCSSKGPPDQNATDYQDGTAMCLDMLLIYIVSSCLLVVDALIPPFSSFLLHPTTPLLSLPLYCKRKFWMSVHMLEPERALHSPLHNPRIWCPCLI